MPEDQNIIDSPVLEAEWVNGIPYLKEGEVEGYVHDPYLDRDADQDWWGERLPHLNQEWKMVFVTFRLADSLPLEARLHISKLLEKLRTKVDGASEGRKQHLHSNFDKRFNEYLDVGSGECHLRRKDLRDVVEGALLERDGIDYWIISYVIVPNHVHVLLRTFGHIRLDDIVRRIKWSSAKRIIEILGEGSLRDDLFWFRNYFDRHIRSYPHFLNTLRYIRENTRTLWASDYTLGGPSVAYMG